MAARGSASGAPWRRRSSGGGSGFDFGGTGEEEIHRGRRGGGDPKGAGDQVWPTTAHIK